MSDVIHPHWCQRATCPVGRTSGRYAIHRSRAVPGRPDPETGTAVSASLWMLDGEQANVLLEFEESNDDGTDLTAAQALELINTLTQLLAESGSVR
ncbi:hypothetical protein ABT297_19630 [Dactylosporangium sp. NPDC000555]|uniref:hypothetical protein n=1 Tax=Dactylosporangium sp. NPDC000555 TaxID=3154260 RepID=UPI0033230F4F